MKYMGSKRFMLRNGLGERILEMGRDKQYNRFVDLFTGSGAVAHFATQHLALPVLACDLQHYATALAKGVLSRTQPADVEVLKKVWLEPSRVRLQNHRLYSLAVKRSDVEAGKKLEKQVKNARKLCEKVVKIGPVWSAYGGYYYSPLQALTIDYLRKNIPAEHASLCMAALLIAASRCVAAPGHTAQPFRPTSTGGVFLVEAWRRDIFKAVQFALDELAPVHAQEAGATITGDALEVAKTLTPRDLVFVDPPYSAEHYSRFYHVLETIAQGHAGAVSGTGRYPVPELRPRSKFSVLSESKKEVSTLIETLAASGATVLFTFPEKKCSNGLSGAMVEEIAREWFEVDVTKKVHGSFSTLGGKKAGEGNRLPKQEAIELLFIMRPKRQQKARKGAIQAPKAGMANQMAHPSTGD